jgi:hypothetical protein
MQNEDIPNFHASAGESIVRACFTSIAGLNPLTSAMASAYFQLMDDKRWRYVERFFEDVRINMESHKERIDELYNRTDNDEIVHLMLIALDKVQFEYQETRRKEYAKLFVNSILLDNKIDFDKKRMFIQLFGELSDGDIDLLGKFYANLNSIHNGVQLELFGRELVDIVPFVMRLESRGLIYQRLNDATIKTTIYEGHKTNLINAWRNKAYGLTPMGMSFCEFISSDL